MKPSIKGDWNEDDFPAVSPERFRLRLYVAGASSNSSRAITNLKSICEGYLHNNYELEIIDVHNDAAIVHEQQLIALPLLVRLEPQPMRRLIGDMSDSEKVLRGLGLK